MKIYTEEEVNEMTFAGNNSAELDEDELGQIVIYTGIFGWKDGTYRDEPEPFTGEE